MEAPMPISRTLPFPMFRNSARSGFRQALAYMFRVATTRQGLAELDDRMLKDLGVSRAQAQFELSRPVWKLMR
jgi:uncharacterized protein YjiS (DUF1127 family)